MLEDETKEESDEEDEEDEGSGRIRFKSERKDGAVVRLADAGSNRRSIPETLGTNDLYWASCVLCAVTTKVMLNLCFTQTSVFIASTFFVPVPLSIRTVREGEAGLDAV